MFEVGARGAKQNRWYPLHEKRDATRNAREGVPSRGTSTHAES